MKKLFFLLLSSSTVFAQIPENRNTLESIRRQALESNLRREKILQKQLVETTDNEEKGFLTFLLGFHFYAQGHTQDANRFFARAQSLLKTQDSLRDINQAYFKLSDPKSLSPQQSVALSKKIFKEDAFRGFRHEGFKILLKSLVDLGKHHEFKTFFYQYLSRFPYGRRDPDILEQAADFFDQKKMLAERNRALEELISLYPYHEKAITALSKFFQKNCDSAGNKIERISPVVLLRLSRHSSTESGLRDFIGNYAKTLPHFAREGELSGTGQFLLRAKFIDEALTFSLNQLNQLTQPLSPEDQARRASILLVLAQAHQRSGDYERAARAASVYLAENETSADSVFARELLADGLALLRLHVSASRLYQLVAQSNKSQPVVKWHQFWNLYLGRANERALDLLTRPGYVPPRDVEVPHGLEYWQARLLEKRGQSSDAEKIFSRLNNEDNHGFYQLMIQARKNDWNANLTSKQKMGGDDALQEELPSEYSQEPGQEFGRNGERKTNTVDLKGSERMLQRIRVMSDLNLSDLAKKFSKGVSWTKIAKSGYSEATLQVAQSLGDHRLVEQLYFASPHPASTQGTMTEEEKNILFPTPFKDLVFNAARTFSVDPYLLYSLMRAESHFDADALSSVGARGLLQIIPTTGVKISKLLRDDSFNVLELSNPGINIYYAAFYIRFLLDHYRGSVIPTIAAYNAGPLAVDLWIKNYSDLEVDEFIESISYKETRKYVKTVLRNYHHYLLARESEFGALKKIGGIPKEVSQVEVF